MTAILNKLIEFLSQLLSAILIVLAPIKPMLIGVIVLVICDVVTGIMASRKLGHKISSNQFNKSIMKVLYYTMGIIVCFILETYFVSDVPFVKFLSTMIALRESKSFFENLNVISGINITQEILSKLQNATAKEQPPVEPVKERPKKKRKKRKK